jgi:hypothetical protein
MLGFLNTGSAASFTFERGICSKYVPDFGVAGRASFVAMRQQ